MSFPGPAITAATGGIITRRVLQNWLARGQWLTPVAAPQHGRAYLYSFSHLIEALIVVELGMFGIPSELARQAISGRLEGEPKNAQRIDALPDFREPRLCWGVSVPRGADGEAPNSVIVILFDPKDLPATIEGWGSFVVLNIPLIVQRAREFALGIEH
jgi:hypothetical protein